MRLHRFYITENIGKQTEIALSNEELAHQLRSVFRLKDGAQVILFDGSGTDYVAELSSLGGKEKGYIAFRIVETRPVKPAAKRRLAIAFSLIKKDNAEWVIEKGTELGVTEFIPLISDRSEKKGFNMERAVKKSIEAAEQSGRSEIPVIHEPQALADFIGQENETRELFVFHTEGDVFEVSERSNSLYLKDIVACVGPEGGWSEKDIASFRAAGARIVKLNAPVLRAETASIAIAALLLI